MIRAAALVVLASSIAAATPVDMRDAQYPTAPPMHAGPFPARQDPAPNSLGPDIMTMRLVLNDLLAIGEVLQHEGRQLDLDAIDLWTQWRAFVPAPSGVLTGASAGVAGPEETRQMEVFGLHTTARNLAIRLQGLMRKLEKSEAEWWKRWKELDAASMGGQEASALAPKFDALKKRLEALASESNTLDAALRSSQSQYDFIRPLALEHLTVRRGATPSPRQPWHWNYVLSGQPRPDMSYDYDARYEQHHEESLEWLRVKRLSR